MEIINQKSKKFPQLLREMICHLTTWNNLNLTRSNRPHQFLLTGHLLMKTDKTSLKKNKSSQLQRRSRKKLPSRLRKFTLKKRKTKKLINLIRNQSKLKSQMNQ